MTCRVARLPHDFTRTNSPIAASVAPRIWKYSLHQKPLGRTVPDVHSVQGRERRGRKHDAIAEESRSRPVPVPLWKMNCSSPEELNRRR